jgi:hypothetical protein
MSLLASSLTYVEILSHLHEFPAEVDLNKSLIRFIYRTAVTDWRLPEQLLAESYNNVQIKEERVTALNEIIDSIVTGDSNDRVSMVGGNFNVSFFADYDKFLSSVSKIENHKEVIKMQKDSYKREEERREFFTEKELTLPYPELIGMFNTKYLSLNFSITIQTFAEMILHMSGMEETESNIEKMYDSYNGKANAFMIAYSLNDIDRMSRHEEWSRNDFIDLLHFLYLDKETGIVSRDKFILDLANRVRSGLGVDARDIYKGHPDGNNYD